MTKKKQTSAQRDQQGTLQNPTLALIEKWRNQNYMLTDEDLTWLDKVMKRETGMDFDSLRRDFDFRFSGAVVKPGPPNNDDYILTEVSGTRRKYALPGGKIAPTNMPFSALRFARWWANNLKTYEDDVFSRGEGALVSILNEGKEQVQRLISPLESLAVRIDKPFQEQMSEIRREGYREFKEEFDLEGFGLSGEDNEFYTETSSEEETSGVEETSGGESRVYILNATPVAVFIEPYRTESKGKSETAAKQWFVSFNYLLEIPGTIAQVDKVLKAELKKQKEERVEEVEGIRWAPLVEVVIEVALRGSSRRYHDSVSYVARRLEAQKKVAKIIPRYGPVDGDYGFDEDSCRGRAVIPETFEWEKYIGKGK